MTKKTEFHELSTYHEHAQREFAELLKHNPDLDNEMDRKLQQDVMEVAATIDLQAHENLQSVGFLKHYLHRLLDLKPLAPFD